MRPCDHARRTGSSMGGQRVQYTAKRGAGWRIAGARGNSAATVSLSAAHTRAHVQNNAARSVSQRLRRLRPVTRARACAAGASARAVRCSWGVRGGWLPGAGWYCYRGGLTTTRSAPTRWEQKRAVCGAFRAWRAGVRCDAWARLRGQELLFRPAAGGLPVARAQRMAGDHAPAHAFRVLGFVHARLRGEARLVRRAS